MLLKSAVKISFKHLVVSPKRNKCPVMNKKPVSSLEAPKANVSTLGTKSNHYGIQSR